MPTFECPDTGKTFTTNNVQIDEDATGSGVQFTAKEECPHCGSRNHTTAGAVEELEGEL